MLLIIFNKNFARMKYFIFLLLALILLFVNRLYTNSLKEEIIRLKSNQELLLSKNNTLLSEQEKYKVADSLNAMKVSALELTLKEYKRYKEETLELVNKLKTKNMNLQEIVTAQLSTINTLSLDLQDSIKINTQTNRVDTLYHFGYNSNWTEILGWVDLQKDKVDLQIKNREALKVVETVKYKRFLGFLWKTNKIKERQVDVLSLNPNTEIISCEYIAIQQ